MTREVTVTIQTTSAGVTVNPGDTRTITLYRDGDPVPAVNGIPAGGATGQVLSKASDADRDVEWSSTGGAAVWGGIGGTLSNQADLQSALDGKATTAQGALADSAVQPGDLATVATTGAYADLSGLPTLGTAAAAATADFATAAQGALADSAVQPARTITAAGLATGGGDLSENRTIAVTAGTTAGTVCEGNDSRLSDARTPTAHDQGSDTISTTLLEISGTTHTADAADDGKVYRLTNASGCAVTIPDSLAAGWSVGWLQVGNAQSTFAGSGSMTLNNRQGHTKSAGQYAAGGLIVQSANSVYLTGDTGA